MHPTDLTVSAVVPHDERFLIVEERASGVIVVNQPGGHIESGESPEQAVVREAMEETGCKIAVVGLLGVYLWIQPQTRQQFLRVVYSATLVEVNRGHDLDKGIRAVHWYTLSDLKRRKSELRTPVVLKCIEDYLAGRRQPDSLLAGISPIEHNVPAVMASACLV